MRIITLVASLVASALALIAPGCATTNGRQVIGWGAVIALDIDALQDGGSTPDERQDLREDAADAVIMLSGNHQTVTALANVLRANGQLTPAQRDELLAALADKPVLQTLAALAVELQASGAFKADDWRAVARALARWAAQPTP